MSDSGRRRRSGVMLLKLGLAVAAVTLVVGGAVMLWGGPVGPDRDAPSRDLARATRMSFDITTNATGELRARNQIELRSRLESRSSIVEIVPEGVQVRAGDVLVRLKSDEIESQIDEETLRVESAKADLIAAENAYEIQVSENESRLRQARLKVELAELALAQWREGDVEKTRLENALRVEEAERELVRLEEKYNRSVELESRGFLSRDELKQDELAFLKAKAALETARLTQEIYETYQYLKDERSKLSELEEAQAELERVERQNAIELASKEADRVNRRRQLAVREQRLAKLREQLEACTIRAPTSGLVVYATSLEGSWRFDAQGPLQIGRDVHPNELLIILPDTSEMIAEVRVHEALASRIRPGLDATVRIEAVGGAAFPGRVESIGVLAESGGWRDPNRREYTVRIALDADGAEAQLKPSMRCEAEIRLGRVEQALAVPVAAVFSDGPVRFVYALRDGRFARVPVAVGRRSDLYAEITAGLDEGATVLVREPEPGRVIDEPWNPDQLRLVGIEVDEDGNPVAPEPAIVPPPRDAARAFRRGDDRGGPDRRGRPATDRDATPGTSPRAADATDASTTAVVEADQPQPAHNDSTSSDATAHPEPAPSSAADAATTPDPAHSDDHNTSTTTDQPAPASTTDPADQGR